MQHKEGLLDVEFIEDDDIIDDLVIVDDSADISIVNLHEPWKILIVDDDKEIHSLTNLMLDDFIFDDKSLTLFSVFSAAEAKRFLKENDDIAVIWLDVVMEADDAGLQVVNYIRNELKNTNVRIILRTGQPGVAPEEFVIHNYDIDNYRAKTEMSEQNMISTMVSSLRAFKEIRRIETIVAQRTKDLASLNSELTATNKYLTDSIDYAYRIQYALLPSKTILEKHFPDNYFIIYKPKAVVSGDIYWYAFEHNKFFISAIDCTGHGVPGALMAVLANTQLIDIIKQQKIHTTNQILTYLHRQVSEHLQQGSSDAHVSDGMDIAMCCLDIPKKILQFSGAQRPLFIFRNGNIIIVEGDKKTIGHSNHIGEERTYNTQDFQLQNNDTLYLFTDGITDQFGTDETNPQRKKFGKTRFIDLLTTIQKEPLNIQKEIIENTIQK